MILIDACNIAGGGGGVLLQFLTDELKKQSIGFHVVAPERARLSNDCSWTRCSPTSPVGNRREKMLRKLVTQFDANCIFCFGNVPPRTNFSQCQVITYFQNAHLIRSIDKAPYSLKNRCRYFLLAKAIRNRLKKTNSWVFQTEYIKSEFCNFHQCDGKNKLVIPFFKPPLVSPSNASPERLNAFIYVSSSPPHKNHLRLLKAWQILKNQIAEPPELILTVPFSHKVLCEKIQRLQSKGVPIRNVGNIDHQSTFNLLKSVRYMIFPSLLETVGLSLVEGTELGCKVLASRLPYVADVIKPSLEFDPYSPEDIAKKAMFAVENELPHSETVIRNQSEELIGFLKIFVK